MYSTHVYNFKFEEAALPSSPSTFCLTRSWSTEARYSRPGGQFAGACGACIHPPGPGAPGMPGAPGAVNYVELLLRIAS